jgi:hypothetical protein
LPEGRGIHKIEISQTQTETSVEIKSVGEALMQIDMSQADRELLNHIRQRLEVRYGVPISNSQVIRWAVWHCSWDEVGSQK